MDLQYNDWKGCVQVWLFGFVFNENISCCETCTQLCCHYGPNKKFLVEKTSIRHTGMDVNEMGVNSEWPEKSLASVILSKCVCHDQSEQQREGICSREKARQACQGVAQSDRAHGLARIWVDFTNTYFSTLSHA